MDTGASEMAREPREPSQLGKLSIQCAEDSQKWFGDTGAFTLPHMTLALAGEVGELANIVKKIDRRSLNYKDSMVQHNLAMETTDCLIYILNIAAILGIDLQLAYDRKRLENHKRFTEERTVRNGVAK